METVQVPDKVYSEDFIILCEAGLDAIDIWLEHTGDPGTFTEFRDSLEATIALAKGWMDEDIDGFKPNRIIPVDSLYHIGMAAQNRADASMCFPDVDDPDNMDDLLEAGKRVMKSSLGIVMISLGVSG